MQRERSVDFLLCQEQLQGSIPCLVQCLYPKSWFSYLISDFDKQIIQQGKCPPNDASLSGKSQSIGAAATALIFVCFPLAQSNSPTTPQTSVGQESFLMWPWHLPKTMGSAHPHDSLHEPSRLVSPLKRETAVAMGKMRVLFPLAFLTQVPYSWGYPL